MLAWGWTRERRGGNGGGEDGYECSGCGSEEEVFEGMECWLLFIVSVLEVACSRW